MERLNLFLLTLFMVNLLSSCSVQKEYVQLDENKLIIANNTDNRYCIDNDLIISVLENNDYKYVVENNNIYIDSAVSSNRDFINTINDNVREKLESMNIPEGYTPFKYRRLNVKLNRYETRPLDNLDKELLPDIIKRGGFRHIFIDECLYVEREMIDNQDFLSKAIRMLDYRRGDAPFD